MDTEELWLPVRALLEFGAVTDRLGLGGQPSFVYAVVTVVGWTVLSTATDLLDIRCHADLRDEPGRFLEGTPGWLPWTLSGLAGLQLLRTGADLATFSTSGLIANGCIRWCMPLSPFSSCRLRHEFVPWRLYTFGVGIFFPDPHSVGGIRPIGEPVKKAHYYVFLGLLVYALIACPRIEGWEVSAAGTIFTSVWVATIDTVGFAVLVLHRLLHREKRHELQCFEDALHDLIERPWDVREHAVPDDAREDVEDLRERV